MSPAHFYSFGRAPKVACFVEATSFLPTISVTFAWQSYVCSWKYPVKLICYVSYSGKGHVTKMKLWKWSHSIQQKTIVAMVLVGLIPVLLSLLLTYVEERRALRETIGSNFKGIATEVARKKNTKNIGTLYDRLHLQNLEVFMSSMYPKKLDWELKWL